VKARVRSLEEKDSAQNELEMYTLPLDELAARFGVDPTRGLSQEEAEERRRICGPNIIPSVRPNLFKVYFSPFLNWLIDIYLIMSTALAILAFFLVPEAWSRAILWFSIIAVNALIAIIQQARAQTRLKALEELSAPRSKVVRGGKLMKVSSEQIVPGDTIKLEQGDKIPADARIIDASDFRVNEASLTGESEEVEKLEGEMQVEECEALSGIKNTVFLGTYVTTGCASALVIKTGKGTQIGWISTNLKEINTGEILLREKVNKLAKYLALAVLFYLSITVVSHIAFPSFVRGDLFMNGALNLRLVATEVCDRIITAMSIMPINIPLLTTIVLVTGVLVMASHRVIIRDLNAVESLGRVSVLCSDKTGTITKDEMTVKWIFLPSIRRKSILYGVTGNGYQPNGRILAINSNVDLEKLLEEEPEVLGGSEAEIKAETRLELLLASGLLNNEGSIAEEKVKTDRGEEVICKALGDATNASILILFRKSKLEEDLYKSNFREVRNYPFDSRQKRATKVFKHSDRYVVFSKGATETILPLCAFIAKDGVNEVEALNNEGKAFIDTKADVFSASGFRVISFAFKYLDELPSQSKGPREFLENDLTYLGFVAIIDPPREGVLESVSEAKSAGIKIVMITGDNLETGKSIAEEVGIFEQGTLAVEGCDIERLSDEEFLKVSVFARVSPEHKMDIIDRYKKKSHVVAMTGDGVNDALAIAEADVGMHACIIQRLF
jgi:Ca2+-transporting ATPase